MLLFAKTPIEKRQKLNNLFKPLPRDMQRMVLNYLNEPYYLNKYNKSITRVLSNKIDKIIHKISEPNSSSFYVNCIYTKFYED